MNSAQDLLKSEGKTFKEFKLIVTNKGAYNETLLDNKVYVQNMKQQSSIIDAGKCLLQNAKDGELEKIRDLISKGAPFITDWLGTSALHFAAMSNHYDICDMLLRGGINKDAKTKVDRTPLHFAVFYGHLEIVKLLLAKNCDVNALDMLKMTPLHWAIENRFKAIARLLLLHGADPTIVSKFGKTAKSLAIKTGQRDLLHDIELAKQLKIQNEQQSETNDAINSIEYDPEEKSDLDLSATLASKADVPSSMNINHISSQLAQKAAVNSPVSNIIDSNSESTMEDDDLSFVEPIVQLHNVEDQPTLNDSAIKLLKSHGISMLPVEDSENTPLTSALQSGRKLVLSEAGKLVLNNTNLSRNDNNSVLSSQLDSSGASILSNLQKTSNVPKNINVKIGKKPNILIRAKEQQIKQNKNIKVISVDTFKQMYGKDPMSSIKNITSTKSNNEPTKTSINFNSAISMVPLRDYSRNKSTVLNVVGSSSRNNIKHIFTPARKRSSAEMDDLPPNIIEVCSDSDVEEDSEMPCQTPPATSMLSHPTATTTANTIRSNNQLTTTNSMKLTPVPAVAKITPMARASKIPSLETSVAPVLDIIEASRQIFELKKQLDDLQRQLEVSRKQSEEYKVRLERLEQERDSAAVRRQNS